MKTDVFWDVRPCGDVSEDRIASISRVTRMGELGTLLATANIVPSSPILVTLLMEVIRSSEISDLTRATRRNIPEDILHSHCCENFKSYIALTGSAL
jgi:hypothetical protein